MIWLFLLFTSVQAEVCVKNAFGESSCFPNEHVLSNLRKTPVSNYVPTVNSYNVMATLYNQDLLQNLGNGVISRNVMQANSQNVHKTLSFDKTYECLESSFFLDFSCANDAMFLPLAYSQEDCKMIHNYMNAYLRTDFDVPVRPFLLQNSDSPVVCDVTPEGTIYNGNAKIEYTIDELSSIFGTVRTNAFGETVVENFDVLGNLDKFYQYNSEIHTIYEGTDITFKTGDRYNSFHEIHVREGKFSFKHLSRSKEISSTTHRLGIMNTNRFAHISKIDPYAGETGTITVANTNARRYSSGVERAATYDIRNLTLDVGATLYSESLLKIESFTCIDTCAEFNLHGKMIGVKELEIGMGVTMVISKTGSIRSATPGMVVLDNLVVFGRNAMLVVERGVKIKLNPNLWVNPENEKLYYDEEFLTEVAPDDENRTKFAIGDHMGSHIVVVDSLDKESWTSAYMNKKHENYLSLYSEATSKGWLCSDVETSRTTCVDGCGIPNGDGNSCRDLCWVQNGDNTACADCNGTLNGTAVVDDCGQCGGNNTLMDDCGVCEGENRDMDVCGVCNGNGTSCLDVCGIPNGNGTSCNDKCGVPNGLNECCFGLTGLGVETLNYGASVETICPSGKVGVRTVTCNDGTLIENDVDCKDITDKQAARAALKGALPASAKTTKRASYSSPAARKTALNAAKKARRDYIKQEIDKGLNWKDLVIEDDGDFEGYSDTVLAKRQAKNTKIRYRVAPANLTCSFDPPDLVLTKEDGMDTVDPEACVTIQVDGEAGVIKMEKTGDLFNISCNNGGVSTLDTGATFTCEGRVWDIGSVTTDPNDVYGCMDPTACNYDVNATVDDGCLSLDACGVCGGDGVCDDDSEIQLVVRYNGQRYEACEGTTLKVLKNGTHNVWEKKEGGNVAVIEQLSTIPVTTTLLGAPAGTTREFYCSEHPDATFKISCCDPKYGAVEYINNQCCGC
jgi:hypothetical protein